MARGFQPGFDITNRITAALTRIERARGFLEAATLSEDWVREMGERALVLEAHYTTHIEGTRLTLKQSERQSKALWHVIEHGNLTIQDFERICPDVNRRSLRRDLKILIDKGVLVEVGTSSTDPTKRYRIRN